MLIDEIESALHARTLPKIYLAAPVSLASEMESLSDLIGARRLGRVISRWHNPGWQQPRPNETSEDLRMARIGRENLEDLLSADYIACMTGTPSTRGGRHVEFGFGIARLIEGILPRLYVVGPRENTFSYLDKSDWTALRLRIRVLPDVEAFLAALEEDRARDTEIPR
jgi:hypothetical protein